MLLGVVKDRKLGLGCGAVFLISIIGYIWIRDNTSWGETFSLIVIMTFGFIFFIVLFLGVTGHFDKK